jgi:hypothetical protein
MAFDPFWLFSLCVASSSLRISALFYWELNNTRRRHRRRARPRARGKVLQFEPLHDFFDRGPRGPIERSLGRAEDSRREWPLSCIFSCTEIVENVPLTRGDARLQTQPRSDAEHLDTFRRTLTHWRDLKRQCVLKSAAAIRRHCRSMFFKRSLLHYINLSPSASAFSRARPAFSFHFLNCVHFCVPE